MKAELTINGNKESYPEHIIDLENLILFVMNGDRKDKDIVVEVKVDGENFSEAYQHQASDMSLEDLQTVEFVMNSKEEFARKFMTQASGYIAHLQNGFRSAIELLKDSSQEEDGHDMLARSLEMLRALKCHSDNASRVLGKSSGGTELSGFWARFDEMTEKINEAQIDVDHSLIASLLEKEMLPFLEDWKTRH